MNPFNPILALPVVFFEIASRTGSWLTSFFKKKPEAVVQLGPKSYPVIFEMAATPCPALYHDEVSFAQEDDEVWDGPNAYDLNEEDVDLGDAQMNALLDDLLLDLSGGGLKFLSESKSENLPVDSKDYFNMN